MNRPAPDKTRDAVKRYYGSHARRDTSCCSPQASFYSDAEIDILPDDVASFSLGCGNAVGSAALKPGETVLDLGSGGGLECFIAAQQVGASGHVIGIDMTEDMLARARRAADRLGFHQVEFRQGLIEALPVEDSSVDVIISNCVINLSPDKAAVFREMHRVLRPGGRIAISDIVTQAPVPEKYQRSMRLWSACASGAVPVAEWEQSLRALGFEAVTITPVGEGDEAYAELIPESRPFSAMITAIKSV